MAKSIDGEPPAVTSLFETPATSRGRRAAIAVVCLVLAALPATVEAQVRSPIVALAQDMAAGTDDLYYLDLGDGTVTHADRLRRDPLDIRARRIAPNLFQEIGRPTDQPAAVGEILLAPIRSAGTSVRAALFVEASTGYVAFFDQLGKNDVFGKFSSALGRPFAPLASADGNYALLPRHDGNGRTQGAYLYHAGSGRGLYLDAVAKLRTDAAAVAVTGFPRLAGQVAAAELQSSESTVAYLIADAADGSLRFLDLEGEKTLVVRDRPAGASPLGLFPTFAAEAAVPARQRFVAVPLRNAGETTNHVLFVDATTGDLAVLDGLGGEEASPALTRLPLDLYATLGTTAGAGARVIAAVPNRTGSGATAGVWLIDSLTRRIAYIAGAETPTSATARRVRVGS